MRRVRGGRYRPKETGLALTKLVIVIALVLGIMGTSIFLHFEQAFGVDRDGDGLKAPFENAIGTDDRKADSDGDNLNDYDEIFVYGTDPNNANTDGDWLNDDVDPDPLVNGSSGGSSTIGTITYAAGGAKPNQVGTTPIGPGSVNVLTGEKITGLASINFGDGVMGPYLLTFTTFANITYPGRAGNKVIMNWDLTATEDVNGNVTVLFPNGEQKTFTKNGSAYVAEAACPWELTLSQDEEKWLVTCIPSQHTLVFDRANGVTESIDDRFGNSITINRNSSKVITSFVLPEGNTITVTTHATGRYHQFTDWSTTESRTWTLDYNCFDELAGFTDAEGNRTKFYYVNATQVTALNGNLTRIVQPTGTVAQATTYRTSGKVETITVAGSTCIYRYPPIGGSTRIVDFAGNALEWKYSSGKTYPNSLAQYSNRNVRSTDPDSWTTTFSHDANSLRTRVLLPEGSVIECDWNSNYLLTERRHKEEDTGDSSDDLVWTFTYDATWRQLEDTTDPKGNTTERTLDSSGRVTRIDYESITHTDPDISVYETFTWNSDGTMATHTDGAGVVTKYDYFSSGAKNGLLKSVTKDYGIGKLNLVTQLDYSEWRWLTSSTDPDGSTWTYVTDKLGRREKSTSPSPQSYEAKFTFNGNGWLTQQDVENVDETNTRDTANPWFSTTISHDAVGRVTAVTEEISASDTRTTTMVHDGNGAVSQYTLPEGNVIKMVRDERGLLAERTIGLGGTDAATEKWTFDGNGNVSEFTTARGKTSQYDYDGFDRLVKAATPLGHYQTLVYDENGNCVQVSSWDKDDNLLASQKKVFDELNRAYEVIDWLDADEDGTWDDGAAENLTIEVEIDNRGLVVGLKDPEDNAQSWVYDNAGRQLRHTDTLGNYTSYAYTDDFAVPTLIQQREKTPSGGNETYATEQVTDALHRVVERRIVDLDNSSNKHIHKWKLNSVSVAVEYEDAESNKTWLENDALGRIIKKSVDLGGGEKMVIEYAFDKNGNLTAYTDDAGNVTTYRYNDRDEFIETEYDDNKKRTMTRNADGTVSGWTDANGTVVTDTLDDDGRLTARAITAGTGVIGPDWESYTWDGLGRMLSASNADAAVTRAYDTLSRLVSETQSLSGGNGKTIAYTHNADNSRASVQYPSGYKLDYTVDAIGRWTDTTKNGDSTALVSKTFFGPGFRVEDVTYQSGATEEFSFDGFRLVAEIEHYQSGSTKFAGFQYGYDQMGNPLHVARYHDGGNGDVYAYDQAYRLTDAVINSDTPGAESATNPQGNFGNHIDFNMDDVSNRTSVVTTPQVGPSVTVNYSSNELNQYTNVGGTGRTHDDNGNLTDDGTLDYAYDYRNNMVKVMSGAIVLMEAKVDPLGRRVEKSAYAGLTVTEYYYDGKHCVEEYDSAGFLARKFVYGQTIDDIEVMIAADVADVDDDGNTTELMNFYYHHDILGTVTHVTDQNGNLVEQYDYLPYGQTTIQDAQGTDLNGQSAIGNPYMFTARRYEEETGLYHCRRRAYDPETGRFLQRDPKGYVDGSGLMTYVGANPILFADPLGAERTTEQKIATEEARIRNCDDLRRQYSDEMDEANAESHAASDELMRLHGLEEKPDDYKEQVKELEKKRDAADERFGRALRKWQLVVKNQQACRTDLRALREAAKSPPPVVQKPLIPKEVINIWKRFVRLIPAWPWWLPNPFGAPQGPPCLWPVPPGLKPVPAPMGRIRVLLRRLGRLFKWLDYASPPEGWPFWPDPYFPYRDKNGEYKSYVWPGVEAGHMPQGIEDKPQPAQIQGGHIRPGPGRSRRSFMGYAAGFSGD